LPVLVLVWPSATMHQCTVRTPERRLTWRGGSKFQLFFPQLMKFKRLRLFFHSTSLSLDGIGSFPDTITTYMFLDLERHIYIVRSFISVPAHSMLLPGRICRPSHYSVTRSLALSRVSRVRPPIHSFRALKTIVGPKGRRSDYLSA